MTYNVVTNIHAAHKLFVTTTMVKMPIVVNFTTMSNGIFSTFGHHVQKIDLQILQGIAILQICSFQKG